MILYRILISSQIASILSAIIKKSKKKIHLELVKADDKFHGVNAYCLRANPL